MSMSDANKRNIMNLGGDVHLLPLLTNADNLTRWSARQVSKIYQPSHRTGGPVMPCHQLLHHYKGSVS